jgi:outer membrane protein TolC
MPNCCAGPWLILFVVCLMFRADADVVSNAPTVIELSLNGYLEQVLQHNIAVQENMLEAEINRHKERGALGAFEPQLEASVERDANKRTNDVQQQAAQAGQPSFDELNTIYDGGLESLMPTGGKIRLGYTLSDLYNNVSGSPFSPTVTNFTRQYETFVGATFTQPLLKDGGFTPALAELRLAALDSDIAFQEYRRQLMLTVSRAESAYWNLYFAQEQLRYFDDSVSVAQNVLDDSREKLKSGQGSELDEMQAQSDLALRETKRNDALQNYYDAVGTLQTIAGTSRAPIMEGTVEPIFRASDVPAETNAPVSYFDASADAFELNPEYLIQKQKMTQERLRLGVAKNQLLPELNFKASYGYNGLGSSPGQSWDVAESQDYPSWTLGLQLIVPLAGNIKGRNLYHAAELALQEAYTHLKGVETEIANHLNTSLQKAAAWQQSAQNYGIIVHYNEELLKTELQQFKAGTIDEQKLLDAEAGLLNAQQDLANARVQYRAALLEEELASGAILKNRRIDITRAELRRQTTNLMDNARHPAGAPF